MCNPIDISEGKNDPMRPIKMILPSPTFRVWFTLLAILFFVFNGCSTKPAVMPGPTEDTHGLSSDAVKTLRSLELVDDYPLYVMHFAGNTDTQQMGRTNPPIGAFSCSLFAAMGQPGDMLYGRNFDWEFSPALLLFTDPPDGYASVSMVDLTFLGIDNTTAKSLTSLSLPDRLALLKAPAFPFDGMNEPGLAIGMAALPEEYRDDVSYQAERPAIGTVEIIRQILDHARNVDEAIALFDHYNIDFTGGPPVHYLVADSTGKSVLIEFYQGKMIQIPNETAWHLATNHLRCTAASDGGCWRYKELSERLTAAEGRMGTVEAVQLLSDVAQSSTQWSVLYNMTRGDIQVKVGQSHKTVFPFHLDRMKP